MNRSPYGAYPGPGPEEWQEFREVLLSTDNQARLPGGILLKQGQGIVKKGTIIGQITVAGADQGKAIAYKKEATDGSQKALCILDNDQDTTYTDIPASGWIAGIFDSEKLTGLDDGAKETLRLCYFG